MPPSVKRLVMVWVALAALTLGAIVIDQARIGQPLGPWLSGALLASAMVKASLVLGEYLDLRRAPAWNRALRTAIFFLLAALYGLLMIP